MDSAKLVMLDTLTLFPHCTLLLWRNLWCNFSLLQTILKVVVIIGVLSAPALASSQGIKALVTTCFVVEYMDVTGLLTSLHIFIEQTF